MLFVTHNLPLVRSIAQRVVVLQHGRIVRPATWRRSSGARADYTKQLLADAPRLSEADGVPDPRAAS